MSCAPPAVRHVFELAEPAKPRKKYEHCYRRTTHPEYVRLQGNARTCERTRTASKVRRRMGVGRRSIHGPGQPPTKLKGVESSRLIGGFWFVAQIKSTVPDFPYEQILTIGYDPVKKKYIGMVIDSMTSHIWQFEGT